MWNEEVKEVEEVNEVKEEDGAGVSAFEPAVSGDRAAAGAVRSGVHHDDAVAGAQQKLRLADDSDAVVADAVKKQNPAPVGIFGPDFPASKKRSVRRMHVEILAR